MIGCGIFREAEQTKCDERLISLSNALINSTAEINARSDAAQYLLVAKVTAVGKAIRSNLTAAAAINEQVKLAGLKSHGNTADQGITNVVKLALGKDASKDAVTRVARVVASFLDEGIEPDQVQQRLMQNNAEGHHGIRVIYDALRAAGKAKTEKAGHGPNGGLAQDPKQEPPNPAPRPKITTGILDTVLGGRAPLVHVDGEDHAEGGDGEHPPSKQQDIVQVNTGMRTIGGTAPELTPSIAKLNERITELEAELAAWKLEEAKPEKRRRGRRVRSRAEGWRQAVSQGLEAVEVIEEAMQELNSYKEEYQNWLDNMPENLQGSAKAEMLETITSMDFEADLSEITSMFEEADGAELPGMMG